MECAGQKKQKYEITNSMRSIASQTMQASPAPIMPVYARDSPSPVVPYQGRQAPVGTIPVQISPPNIELKHSTKQSPSKGSMEPEAVPGKEKDGATTNGKSGGGDGGDGVGIGGVGSGGVGSGDVGSGGVGSSGIGNRNSGGGGIDSRDGIGGGSNIDGKGDNGFNECPDLTPEILKNILNYGY